MFRIVICQYYSLLQHLRLSVDAARSSVGFLGQFRVPLKVGYVQVTTTCFSTLLLVTKQVTLLLDLNFRSAVSLRLRQKFQLSEKKLSNTTSVFWLEYVLIPDKLTRQKFYVKKCCHPL